MLLAWGFNHEEAARCFAAAAAEDGTMAMAHWGLAFAGGLNYNRPTLSQEEMRCAARHAARAQAPPYPARASGHRSMHKSLHFTVPLIGAIADEFTL